MKRENLDLNSISDNKKFWQIGKPLFSNKVKDKTTIKSVENDEMIDDEIQITTLFHEYFVNIVKKLGLFTKEQSAISTENCLSEVKIAIAKHGNHLQLVRKWKNLITLHLTSTSLRMRKQ